MPHGLQRDPLEDQPKLVPGNGLLWIFGKLEGSRFQTLIIKNKSTAIPYQEFDFISSAVDEYINTPVIRFSIQFITYQTGQAIEAFTHISGRSIQVILHGRSKMDHQSRGISIVIPEAVRIIMLRWLELKDTESGTKLIS